MGITTPLDCGEDEQGREKWEPSTVHNVLPKMLFPFALSLESIPSTSLGSMTGQPNSVSLLTLQPPTSPSAGNKGNLRISLGACGEEKHLIQELGKLCDCHSFSKCIGVILRAHLKLGVKRDGMGKLGTERG